MLAATFRHDIKDSFLGWGPGWFWWDIIRTQALGLACVNLNSFMHMLLAVRSWIVK